MFLSHILRQVNRFHPTFLLVRFHREIQHRRCPRVASRSKVLRIHLTVRNLRNVPEVTMMRIVHFSLLVIRIWRRCLKMYRMAKVSSVEQGCLTCRTVLGLRSKPRPRHRTLKPTTEVKSVEPLLKDVDNLLVTVSFSLDEETTQQICSDPDPETAFNVMVKRRRAEVKVSTLSAEKKRELVEAKDRELNTFVKYSVVEAASRQRISPSSLMKMRWVVTFKDDGSLKARLVVQGFTDQRLGKIPTSSPTASRRSRQIFLTLAASLGFQTHKGDVKCAFLQGDLDEQHVDDNDDDDCKNESAQPVSDTFCEPVPELSRKLQLEHHQCVRLLKAVCGLGQRSKKMVSSCCQRSSKHERRRISHGTLLVDFPRRKRRHSCSVLYVDDFILACSDSPFGKHIFDSINNLYEWGTWESRVFTQCGA